MHKHQSKIEKLIAELAPKGVEFKELGAIATYTRGLTYGKNDEQIDGAIKVLRANNINLSTNTLLFENVKRVKDTVRVRQNQKLQKGDILISTASGSKAHVGKVAFIDKDIDYYFGGFMAVLRTDKSVDSRFLFHLLIGNTFNNYLEKSLASTTINNLSASIMNAFQIPVPPLDIQKEIVKILDGFTALETALEAALEAELEARKKQYEQYRSKLLMFNDIGGVRWVALADLAKIMNGYAFKSAKYSDGGIRVIRISDVQKGKISNENTKYYPLETEEEIKNYRLEKNDLVMSLTGNVGRVAMMSERDLPAGLNQRVACIRIKNTEHILTKFLFHFFNRDSFEYDAMNAATGGGQKNMSTAWLSNYQIPVPEITTQKRIVFILDKLDALVNDISIGLPAELKARRQQYEYYRNKLLTFKEYAKA